jgi:hypothetical protein
MNWSYSLERLPSPRLLNSHAVLLTSLPRDPVEQLTIRLWTNLHQHAVTLSAASPVILYAEVKLGSAPVIEASVVAEVTVVNPAGQLIAVPAIQLLDTGNGDPDLAAQDGVYSRYVTQVPSEGRYTLLLRVTDNHGKAFAPLKAYDDKTRSCCQDPSAMVKITNQKLGSLTRIVKGDSFRLHSIERSSLPPARILNLEVEVITASQELEFAWTSPGEDFDAGKPTSYQLFYSDQPGTFYINMKKAELVESFSAFKSAGQEERRRIAVADPTRWDRNLHFAILAVDRDGNLGQISNVVKAYVPSPVVAAAAGGEDGDIRTSPHSAAAAAAGDVSGTAVPAEKPSKILLYLIVGIVGFIILCLLVVMIILMSFRRKKVPSEEDELEANKSLGGLTADNNGFSVVSDDLESLGREPDVKRFLLSSSHQDSTLGNSNSGPVHSSLIREENGSVCENPYGYAPQAGSTPAYGWSATTNPYVYKDHNETYASIGSFHNTSQDSYVRGGFQPTYAQPIPKNLRPQHIYSNAAVLARQSPHSSQGSIDGGFGLSRGSAGLGAGTVTFQAQPDAAAGPLRVSPDSTHSSEQAATPTKSILKKPRGVGRNPEQEEGERSRHNHHLQLNLHHQNNNNNMQLLQSSDRDSQSSQASSLPKDESSADVRSPSTVSSQQSHLSSTVTTQEEGDEERDVMNFSLERTYLETSFEFSPLSLPAPPSGDSSSTAANAAVTTSPEEAENLANASRSGQPAPPTLPKPRSAHPPGGTPTPPVNQNAILSGANDSSVSGSLDKKIRNCTQV